MKFKHKNGAYIYKMADLIKNNYSLGAQFLTQILALFINPWTLLSMGGVFKVSAAF